MLSDVIAEPASVTTRELSRRLASVLDRVEQGERLIVTRDGEPIAEIIPIDPAQRVFARWVRDGLIADLPAADSAKAATVSAAARQLLSPSAGPSATEALWQMRDD